MPMSATAIQATQRQRWAREMPIGEQQWQEREDHGDRRECDEQCEHGGGLDAAQLVGPREVRELLGGEPRQDATEPDRNADPADRMGGLLEEDRSDDRERRERKELEGDLEGHPIVRDGQHDRDEGHQDKGRERDPSQRERETAQSTWREHPCRRRSRKARWAARESGPGRDTGPRSSGMTS